MPVSERPSLPDLQRWMRWVLTHPDGAAQVIDRPHGKAPLPKNWTRGKEPKRFLPVIGASAEVSQGRRLSIYGDGYFIRIVGVLAANFACVRNVLGEHDFDEHVGREYLVKYPSVHKCIDNIGDRLADFLKTHSHAKHFPFLPDLARIEWAFHESFYTDEWPPLDLDKLKKAPIDAWETAAITLDASVRLLDLKYPVIDLWRDDGKWSHERQHKIKPRKTPTLVYRNSDGNVRVAQETLGSFALLKAFQEGKKFGAALRAAARAGLQPEGTMRLFQEWTELGVIRKVAFR